MTLELLLLQVHSVILSCDLMAVTFLFSSSFNKIVKKFLNTKCFTDWF